MKDATVRMDVTASPTMRLADNVTLAALLSSLPFFASISSEELLNVMRNMGEPATEEDLQRVINMIDINGDGSVDYDEFARAVTKEMQESGFTLV